jgi:hypothetical protein
MKIFAQRKAMREAGPKIVEGSMKTNTRNRESWILFPRLYPCSHHCDSFVSRSTMRCVLWPGFLTPTSSRSLVNSDKLIVAAAAPPVARIAIVPEDIIH